MTKSLCSRTVDTLVSRSFGSVSGPVEAPLNNYSLTSYRTVSRYFSFVIFTKRFFYRQYSPSSSLDPIPECFVD